MEKTTKKKPPPEIRLRITTDLQAAINAAAKASKMPVNTYIVMALANSVSR